MGTGSRFQFIVDGYVSTLAELDPFGATDVASFKVKSWMMSEVAEEAARAAVKTARAMNLSPEETDVVTTWLHDRCVDAARFDVLRGFLPAGARTNLSWDTNLRQARDHLVWLHHHPDTEVRHVARRIHEALSERYPQTFGNVIVVSDYAEATMADNYFVDPNFAADLDPSCSHSVVFDNDLWCALERRPERGPIPPWTAALGNVSSSFLLDYGSFRDVQRHRWGVVRMPLLTWVNLPRGCGTFHPWYIAQLPPHLAHTAGALLGSQYQKYTTLKYEVAVGSDWPVLSLQAFVPMGVMVPVSITQPLPAFIYRVELRSSRHVHPTLRSVVLKEAEWFLDAFPTIPITVDSHPGDWAVTRGGQTIEER